MSCHVWTAMFAASPKQTICHCPLCSATTLTCNLPHLEVVDLHGVGPGRQQHLAGDVAIEAMLPCST